MAGQALKSARKTRSQANRCLKLPELRKNAGPPQKDADDWEALTQAVDEKWEVVGHPIRDAEEGLEEMKKVTDALREQVAKIQEALDMGRNEEERMKQAYTVISAPGSGNES